jgi:hypothetical protein
MQLACEQRVDSSALLPARQRHLQEKFMGTETPNPGSQPKQTPPGKPGIQQPGDDDKDREEGQDIPKTGRDEDEDENETGNIDLPGEGGGDDQADRSRSADNP